MSGYTLSALGSSSASAKAFVTEELSPIQSPSAATKFENSGLGGMEGIEYRVMLSGSDRYYVELTRQGESSCTTCDFATQSAAQDWIDQDRETGGRIRPAMAGGIPALALVDA